MRIKRIEKLEQKEDTGCLTIKDAGDNHNFALSVGVFVKNSSDGRGSSIESIGGNPAGFAELDDLYYFQRKLYRSLKYPTSRVTAAQEKQDSTIIFGGQNFGEVERSEIKWAKFLERQQNKFCDEFLSLFLLHLEFRGYTKEYGLNKARLRIKMVPPNNYIEQLKQKAISANMESYTRLSTNEEFSKTFLMKRYLRFNDEDIKENIDGFEMDTKFMRPEPGMEGGAEAGGGIPGPGDEPGLMPDEPAAEKGGEGEVPPEKPEK